MCVHVRHPRLAAALAALLLACSRQAGAQGDALFPEAAQPPAAPRVVFFGSSTTAGSGASRPERRWTSLVARRLGWIEVNRGLSTSKLTEVGSRTPSAERRWREALAGERPDAVFVMYGANDVTARVPLGDPGTPGTFRHAAHAVLRGIREAFPDAAVVVCTPQPSRSTAARREPYDLALAEAARAVGAQLIHAGSAFPEERLAELSADRLHLNDAGHAALAEFVLARHGRVLERSAAAAAALAQAAR